MYSKQPDAAMLKPLKYLDRDTNSVQRTKKITTMYLDSDTKTRNTKWQGNTYISIAVRYGLPCNSLCLGSLLKVNFHMIIKFR